MSPRRPAKRAKPARRPAPRRSAKRRRPHAATPIFPVAVSICVVILSHGSFLSNAPASQSWIGPLRYGGRSSRPPHSARYTSAK